jgi:hypothetical protein
MRNRDGADSLRGDSPKNSDLAKNRRQPGAEYLDSDDQKCSDPRHSGELRDEILR